MPMMANFPGGMIALEIDSAPIEGSNNPISSNAVAVALNTFEEEAGASIQALNEAVQSMAEGLEALTPSDIGAAVPSVGGVYTLAAAGWAGNAAPYTCTLSGVTGMTANAKAHVGLAMSATTVEYKAAANARLHVTGQGNGTLTFTAFGVKPTVALPVCVIILG